MKQGNVFRGRTVEEAIAKGLKELGLSREEVTIEIIKEGRKRFFKLGLKHAEVRLHKKSEQTDKTVSETRDNRKSVTKMGKIWVDNGSIYCEDPEEGELKVYIPPMVHLYKNNELLKEEATISEEDELKIEFETEEIPTKWEVEVSKDKLEAKLKVEPGTKTSYTLADQKPAKQLTLKAIKSTSLNLTLTAAAIHEKLNQMGICIGIEEDSIHAACETSEVNEFIIATGVKPTEGKDGWLEYKVEINEAKKYTEREDGTIDFREGRIIPAVNEDVELAIIHGPIEGTDGTTIFGDSIQPKKVRPLSVKLGKGAAFKKDDENCIVSTSIGRPSVEKRGTHVIVDVVPKLEHKGDVTIATGNLKFIGDIEVSGNIEENMSIIATGSVEIRGTTSKAIIKAGHSVTHYKNVISSEIIAGNGNRIITKRSKLLKEIIEELSILQKELHQIIKNPSFAMYQQEGIMPMVGVIIQTKKTSLLSMLRRFIFEVKKEMEMLDPEWQTIIETLHQCFIMNNQNCIETIADFDHLVEKLSYLLELTTIPVETGTIVELPSSMNSDIYSVGDVIVNKQGCYNTVIYALGKLEVRGFIRGGRIFAGRGAEIVEAGSKGGALTLIIAPHDQVIKINRALTDTVIQIGKKRHTFTKDISNVVARIDENGELIIH